MRSVRRVSGEVTPELPPEVFLIAVLTIMLALGILDRLSPPSPWDQSCTIATSRAIIPCPVRSNLVASEPAPTVNPVN